MLKQTPLNKLHHEMGAKMVDFGGWEMPLHYGSQIEEHHQVRRDAGMFDVSHMLIIDLQGPAVRSFLHLCLANNVDRLTERGKAIYSCMLNEQGGVVDDLIAYFMSEEWFRLVVNAGTADKDLIWLNNLNNGQNFKLNIKPRRDLAMIAVQGPNARKKVWQVIPGSEKKTAELKYFQAAEYENYFLARTGYTGEDGFEIMLPAEQATTLWNSLYKQNVVPIGLGARDTLRLEAGMNLYGQDMDEETNPLESGLAWTIPLKEERNFIGKTALLNHPLNQQLCGLILLDKGVLRSHQKVNTSHGKGEITSGTYSPTLNCSIALARLSREVNYGDQVSVEVRDKFLSAKVVKYPFVRNGKSLIQ
jgi:aminomethyltransferase